MKFRTLLLIFLSIVVVIILLGLGIGFLIGFINDKFGDIFLWATFIILVVLSLIYLVRDEIKSKKELARRKSQYLELGKLLFRNHTNEFDVFYASYLKDDNGKSSQNPRPIDALHEFADKKGLSLIIDWKGEENEGEIQDFINAQTGKTVSWTNTTKLREGNTDKATRDGKFIIRLFKAIDKDLKAINKMLLFFELGTDAYICTVTDTTTFRGITKIESKHFHGTAKFKAP
jgi:hypothetical protein